MFIRKNRDFTPVLPLMLPTSPLVITILEDYKYMLSLKEKLESVKQLLNPKITQKASGLAA